MATYRPVHTRIWQDPDFEEYSEQEKLIFFWLITNSLTTESGIYPVSFNRISNETGISAEKVEEIFRNGLKGVTYDFENRCVFIHNFTRYNGRGRPELLELSILKDCDNTSTPLWHHFIERYPRFAKPIKAKLKEINNDASTSISISKAISIDDLDKSLPTLDQVPEKNKESPKKKKAESEASNDTLEANEEDTWKRINVLKTELKPWWPEVGDFIGKANKTKKHPGSILKALEHCYLYKPEKPFAYAWKVVQVESGNYHYEDYMKKQVETKQQLEKAAGNDFNSNRRGDLD